MNTRAVLREKGSAVAFTHEFGFSSPVSLYYSTFSFESSTFLAAAFTSSRSSHQSLCHMLLLGPLHGAAHYPGDHPHPLPSGGCDSCRSLHPRGGGAAGSSLGPQCRWARPGHPLEGPWLLLSTYPAAHPQAWPLGGRWTPGGGGQRGQALGHTEQDGLSLYSSCSFLQEIEGLDGIYSGNPCFRLTSTNTPKIASPSPKMNAKTRKFACFSDSIHIECCTVFFTEGRGSL